MDDYDYDVLTFNDNWIRDKAQYIKSLIIILLHWSYEIMKCSNIILKYQLTGTNNSLHECVIGEIQGGSSVTAF